MNKQLDSNENKLENNNYKNCSKKSPQGTPYSCNNNFDNRNELLKKNCIRGDIFYADLGEFKGSEQGGRRPVIIIQNDTGNKHSPTVIVAIITSQFKNHLPTHVDIHGFGLDRNSTIMLEQIRTLSKKDRLLDYVGTVDKDMMKKVNKACLISLGISA